MRIILILLSFFVLFSCKNETHSHAAQHEHAASDHDHDKKSEAVKPFLIHNVYFWAKEGTSEERLKDLEKGLVALGTCPSIQNYYWGPSAPTEARDVVDHSYDYSVSVHFASIEDQDAYQTDPIHLKFIEDCQDIWGKVIVYDNVVK